MMKNYLKTFLILFFLGVGSVSFSQTTTSTSTCNLQVYIDSIVVQPCFKIGGGACGCNNTLWAVVSGGTAPYHYHWTPNGETTDSIFNVCYVDFSVKVTDANGCVAYDSLNVVIPSSDNDLDTSSTTAATGINNYTKANSISVYPVPASDKLLINFSESLNNTTIEIYNLQGEKMLSQNCMSGIQIVAVDISSLPEGNYLLRANSLNKTLLRKFIKAK